MKLKRRCKQERWKYTSHAFYLYFAVCTPSTSIPRLVSFFIFYDIVLAIIVPTFQLDGYEISSNIYVCACALSLLNCAFTSWHLLKMLVLHYLVNLPLDFLFFIFGNLGSLRCHRRGVH